MKSLKLSGGVLCVVFTFALVAGFLLYTPVKVPTGHVGVKVFLLGGKKGVDHEVVGVGRYFLTINQDMFKFPTYTQNYVWTKDPAEGSPDDESITFQDVEGLRIGGDVGISYRIAKDGVGKVFEKYRKGVDEITDIYLRNMVRDAFVTHASVMQASDIYGSGKKQLLDAVTATVREEVGHLGIIVEKIYLVGAMRLPTSVIAALNKKLEANQRAQQRQNEVAEAMAQANKDVAIAEGQKRKRVLQAEGKAEATLMEAEAQAKANRLLAESLTPELVQYKGVIRWDGVLPRMTGSAIPMISFDAEMK